ncbi:hypothetical protein BaRGS_00034880 [Batillaria attramentaria]|uniref:Uncharacterized protein n=1 Tax=Batillaria attramentaria TaxID=370345 RepID=A0ABD0JG46_9CAEN
MENVPYQFEPLATEADLWIEWSSEDEEEEEASLPTESQRDWCKCGKCPEPARELERVCCHDYGEVVSKFEPGRQSCITEHEGVFVNCLSKNIQTCGLLHAHHRTKKSKDIAGLPPVNCEGKIPISAVHWL